MEKTFADNKRALRNYSVLKEYEAGIVLIGYEVKAIRGGKTNLAGSHVIVRDYEAYLVGASIAPYQPKNIPDGYDPEKPRKLLLNQKEIRQLAQYEKKKGLTIIPVSVYGKNRYIKVRIAVVRGAKKHDKREKIKLRDTERDIQREHKKHFNI